MKRTLAARVQVLMRGLIFFLAVFWQIIKVHSEAALKQRHRKSKDDVATNGCKIELLVR